MQEFDLGTPDEPVTESVDPPRRSRLAALVIGGLAVIAAIALLLPGGEPQAVPAPTPTAAPSTEPEPAPESTVPADEPDPTPRTAELDPEPTLAGHLGLVAATGDDGIVRFWTLDLGSGRAVERPLRGIEPTSLTEFRIVDRVTVVAVDPAGALHRLRLAGDVLQVDRTFAVPDGAVSLGLRGVSPDHRSVWVENRLGLFRWDLPSGEVVERWVDLDDMEVGTPRVLGTADGGLVVEAGGSVFVIRDGVTRRTTTQHEVVAVSGPWILFRSCTGDLRCGELHGEHTVTGDTVDFPRTFRYRTQCGETRQTRDALVVAAQNRADSAIAVVGDDLDVSMTQVHLGNLGCVGVSRLSDGRLVLAYARGLSITDGTEVVTRNTTPLGTIVAASFDPLLPDGLDGDTP